MVNIYPATSFDWYNYIAQDVNSNSLIQFVLKIDGIIEYGKLLQALKCCIMAEPILSSTIICREGSPKWQQNTVPPETVCREISTGDSSSAIKDFLAEEIDVRKEIPVKICVIHCMDDKSDSRDTLVIKVHHALCDGMAAVQFVKLLAQCYSSVSEAPDFVPEEKPMLRDSRELYKYFDVTDRQARLDMSLLEDMTPTWGTPTGDGAAEQSFDYRLLQIESSSVEKLKKFASDNGGSLNALLTAAYHRALVKVLGIKEASKEIQFTADIRRFSPRETEYSLCNFSNIFNISLPAGGDFASLVRETADAIAKAIEPERVLQTVLASELMSANFSDLGNYYKNDWKNICKSGLCTPLISNLGKLSDKMLYFGNSEVSQMHVVSPAFTGPALMLSAGTYNGTLTLCAAYRTPSTPTDFVAKLLKEIGAVFGI